MSDTMNSHIRHLQERLKKAERERDEALAALRPFADAYRMASKESVFGMVTVQGWCRVEHFARAADLVPESAAETRKSRPD